MINLQVVSCVSHLRSFTQFATTLYISPPTIDIHIDLYDRPTLGLVGKDSHFYPTEHAQLGNGGLPAPSYIETSQPFSESWLLGTLCWSFKSILTSWGNLAGGHAISLFWFVVMWQVPLLFVGYWYVFQVKCIGNGSR